MSEDPTTEHETTLEPWLKEGDGTKVVVHLAVERMSIRQRRIEEAAPTPVITDFEPPSDETLAANPYVAYLHVTAPEGDDRVERYLDPFATADVQGFREWITVRLKVEAYKSISEPVPVSESAQELIDKVKAVLDDPPAEIDGLPKAVDELVGEFRRRDENSSK